MQTVSSMRFALPIIRPTKREHCVDGPRPCPWVTCRYNLYLEVTRRGIVQFSKGEVPVEDIPPHESCALDVADRGGISLEKVAAILGLTRERIRQVAIEGLRKVKESTALNEYAREDGWKLDNALNEGSIDDDLPEESSESDLTGEEDLTL